MSKKTADTAKKVAVIMGSDSDYPTMKEACEVLDEFDIAYDTKIISAHRTPDLMAEFAKGAAKNGYAVIIAGAGGAAHLPGMVAAFSELPVIGVPVEHGPLQGKDALLSVVQMPRGVPVATVAIGNAYNAGVLAAQMLAVNLEYDAPLAKKIRQYKADMALKVQAKKLKKQSK